MSGRSVTPSQKRDPYTAGHQGRVADIAVAIAERIGLQNDRVEGLRMGSMIHDIGKIAIPAETLNRPDPLSGVELQMIRMHARTGYDIVEDVNYPWPVAEMILARIFAVRGDTRSHRDVRGAGGFFQNVVAAQAMTSHRPYRRALGAEATLREIEGDRGRLYDPDAVDAWPRIAREGHVRP